QYESGWYTSCAVAPATLERNKRPAQDGEESDKSRSAKRRNVGDRTQSPILYPKDDQVDHEQVLTSPIPPHLPSKAPALRIKVPRCDQLNIPYLVGQAPTSPFSYSSSLHHQEYVSHHPPSTLSGWRFLSPLSPSNADPPHSPQVMRNVLHASSSYDVQWRKDSRQHSFAEYVNHRHKGDLAPPRQYTTSPCSPLFPPIAHTTYPYGEGGFEQGRTRSMSPEPFSRRDSQHVPECVVSSSLKNEASFRGKRRALIIVLEYGAGQQWGNGSSMGIRGPYGDGEDINQLLREQGYHEHEITFMSDSPNTPFELQPTCENIKYELGQFVADAAPGDRFFLYYAGHGLQVNDIDGDEADGLDEAIVPSDWATKYNYSDEGLIIDDYLKEACVNPLPKGAHLTAVFDCCHAGTIMDLTYEHSAKQNGLGFQLNSSTGLSSRRLPSRYQSVDGRVLCISACEDNQQAYAQQRGLLTQAFTTCIRGFAKSYELAGVAFPINPTLKQLYEYLLQYGRPDPKKYGHKYIQDPMLATTFKMSVLTGKRKAGRGATTTTEAMELARRKAAYRAAYANGRPYTGRRNEWGGFEYPDSAAYRERYNKGDVTGHQAFLVAVSVMTIVVALLQATHISPLLSSKPPSSVSAVDRRHEQARLALEEARNKGQTYGDERREGIRKWVKEAGLEGAGQNIGHGGRRRGPEDT
ncbi:unnamed protein product, partial [Rhizoctonia solani]